MNLSDFVGLARELLAADDQYGITAQQNALINAITTFAQNPTDAASQEVFMSSLSRLKTDAKMLETNLSPNTFQNLTEIGADRWFTRKFVDDIYSTVEVNPLTPAIVRDVISDIVNHRATFVARLRSVVDTLEEFGVDPIGIAEGDAVGRFLLPRTMFGNNLQGFDREVRYIIKLIDVLNEISINSVPPIELNTLSTTDPQISISLAFETAKTLGDISLWAVGLLGGIEGIRRMKAGSENLKADSAKKISEILNTEIDERIKAGIEEKIASLLGIKLKDRKAELANALSGLLQQFLARVERGMFVTVQALPFSEEDTENIKMNEQINAVNLASKSVRRLSPPEDGVLMLSYSNDNDSDNDADGGDQSL